MAYRFSYRVVLASEASPDEIMECLESAGFEAISVNAREVDDSRVTKGNVILDIIKREAAKPEGVAVLTRAQVAEEASATVGRVADIIREMSRLPEVEAYTERVRTQRTNVKTQRALEAAAAKAAAKAEKAMVLAKAAADAAKAAALAQSAIEGNGEEEAA